MNKFILFILLFYSVITLATAQDIITLRSGKELKAKIIHLNTKDVILIPENISDTISLLRNEVAMLKYQSGIVIYLTDNETPLTVSAFTGPESDSLFALGEKDAIRYYKGYRPAQVGTLITSIFIPFGLVPALACSSTPPGKNSLGYKDQKLMENSSYYSGYTIKAYEIKKKKVWRGFAIGTGAAAIYVLFVGALVSLSL
jgi:hypothetical protein